MCDDECKLDVTIFKVEADLEIAMEFEKVFFTVVILTNY